MELMPKSISDKDNGADKAKATGDPPEKDVESQSGDGEGLLFKDMTPKQKAKSIFMVFLKIALFLGCLYVFICSLGLLESAFQLLGGKTAGHAFSSGVLSNPLAGLMIGVLSTVLVQSSSTSSSIVVTMVGSDIIPVENAVPIIMGANIGTSVTNTIVSLTQANKREEFRRAFAGATVHDMFNWSCVIVLLPIEIAVGYLYWLSGEVVDSLGLEGNNTKAPDMLKAITDPVISAIVEINKDVITDVATNSSNKDEDVLKRWCKQDIVLFNETTAHCEIIKVDCVGMTASCPLDEVCQQVKNDANAGVSVMTMTLEWETVQLINKTENVERCDNLFAQTDLSDPAAGAILLIVALFFMIGALFLIVKILNSLLQGTVSNVIKNTINADFPGPFAYFTGYVALLVGCGMTIIVQSSSVFTSTLTPLVGLGIVSVERMYPMTLGSNVGTTVTAILAALSQSGDKLRHALQIAMCHLFFNISGIILFYPIPFMRFPVGMAKVLGKTTSKHRWFAVFYLIAMFLVFPGIVFALSYAGWIYLAAIGGPLFLFGLTVIFINTLQKKRPRALPMKLRNWDFLPLWMHSLKPIDKLIERVFRCKYCLDLTEASKDDSPDPYYTEMEVEVDVSPETKDQLKVKNEEDTSKLDFQSVKANKETKAAEENMSCAGQENKAFHD